jgi:hypothetical protein
VLGTVPDSASGGMAALRLIAERNNWAIIPAGRESCESRHPMA